MDRLRGLFLFFSLAGKKESGEQEYEPLAAAEEEQLRSSLDIDGAPDDGGHAAARGENKVPFSWVEYCIFALIGVAMLWAWNMFLAAAPYFQKRFAASPAILTTFQSAIISVSTVTNLLVMTYLTHAQRGASYTWRINAALALNVAVFALLTLSTTFSPDASPAAYLVFTLAMVAASSWATGLIQNGAFALAGGWGRPEYIQAIMAGQGVAGVLPPIAEVVSVLLVPEPGPSGDGLPDLPRDKAGTAALIYFLAAVAVSLGTLAAFAPLARRHSIITASQHRGAGNATAESATTDMGDDEDRAASPSRGAVGLFTLFKKLRWAAGAVFMCFAVTMFFPVFTAKIVSVRAPSEAGRLFQPSVFIPLAFFWWNLGDLLGRVGTVLPLPFRDRPAALFVISVLRLLFLPMYLLCNVGGRGAVVNSDLFYLLAVQFLFGLTNGWLGSSSMMVAGTLVPDAEKAAAGSFMGLCLVAGLTAGSLLSFTVAGI